MFERHGVNFVFFACVGNSKERDEKKSIKEYLERIFSIMHSENFERFFSYYHKMIQSLENFFVSNKRDLLHFRFPVDRLPPKTRSIILKLLKRRELIF